MRAPVESGRNRDSASDRALLAAAAADAAALALRARARLEPRDERRRAALLTAASLDHLRVARLVVALGADADAFDDRHDTPWLVRMRNGV